MEPDDSEAPGKRRHRYYIDPDTQLPLVLGLIFIVTFEGALVGWGVHQAVRIAQDWQNARQIFEFFAVLIGTLLPLVGVNFWLGTWFTHKVIGPVARIQRAMSEVARGNLDCEISLRDGDFLRAHVQDVNSAIQAIRRLIYRDRQYVRETDDILTQCRERLTHADVPSAPREEINKLIAQAKSRLSIVNAHFVKGKEGRE